MFLAWLNYRGVYATLTFNLVLTATAFVAILILIASVQPWTNNVLKLDQLLTGLPYGWLGVLAALHFGLWYYLGIEGTCQAAEEVRSPPRALPLGTMTGIITLLIVATMTWYVCVGLMPWEYLGQAITPLFDAARLTGSTPLMALLFVGTIFSTLASANGCFNDASRAWFSMGRDRYLPTWFGAVHPKNRTPHRSIVFLVPVAVLFAYFAPLDQVITFSILSGLLGYTVHVVQHGHVPKQVAARKHQARIRASVPSAARHRAPGAVLDDLLRGVPRIWNAARGDDGVLYRRFAVVPLPPLQVRPPRRSVHDAVAAAAGLLIRLTRKAAGAIAPAVTLFNAQRW
jgi:L-asparagine transporter-like permease